MGWNSQNITSLLIIQAGAQFSGLFAYSPSPGTGNLIASVAAVAGTDPYGNTYQPGVTSYVPGTMQFVQLSGGFIQWQDASLTSELWRIEPEIGGAGPAGVLQFIPPITQTATYFFDGDNGFRNSISGTSTAEIWHAPTLGTGWATGSVAAGFQPVRFRLTCENLVEIIGIVHSTSATPASTIWTMPAGYFNPTSAQRLGVTVNNNAGSALAGFLSISTAGVVSLTLPAISATGEDVMIAVRFPLS